VNIKAKKKKPGTGFFLASVAGFVLKCANVPGDTF
jgi:hypothetical protein